MPSTAPGQAVVTACSDLVVSFAAALDGRDWDLMRSLLTDPVEVDYGSIGSVQGELPVEAWISRLKALHGFDATHHAVTNFRVVAEDGRAICTSYVNALHFLQHEGRAYEAHACGTYVHEFAQAAGSWKIRKCAFRLAGHLGGAPAFQEAFARARALAASRHS